MDYFLVVDTLNTPVEILFLEPILKISAFDA